MVIVNFNDFKASPSEQSFSFTTGTALDILAVNYCLYISQVTAKNECRNKTDI